MMNNSILTIKVHSVSLKLKFRCRMRLELKDGTFTKQVEPQNAVYQFEELLRVVSRLESVEINILLITEKGSQYNGGVVKISAQQVQNASNLSLRLPVSKCIDKQAWCQLQIIKENYKNAEVDAHLSINRQNQEQNYLAKTGSKVLKKTLNFAIQSNLGETKSEYCTPLPISPFQSLKLQNKPLFQQPRGRRQLFGQLSQIRTSRPKYAKESPQNISYRDNSPEMIDFREKVKQAMDSAQFQAKRVIKMEQRLAKQTKKLQQLQNHRKLIQNSEQALKIEVIKLKSLNNELQKELKKRQSKAKDLTSQNAKGKEVQKQLTQIKQELKKVKMENQSLKNQIQRSEYELNHSKTQAEQQKSKYELQISSLRTLISANQREEQKLKQRNYFLSQSTQNQLANTNSQLNGLTLELQKLIKKRIEEQSVWREKHNESQKLIAQLKKQLKKQKQENLLEQKQLQAERQALLSEIGKSKNELQKQKLAYFKVLSQKRLIQHEKQDMSSRLNGLSEMKRTIEKQQSMQAQINQEKILVLQQNAKLQKKIAQLIDDFKKMEKSKKEQMQRLAKQLIQFSQKCRQAEKKLQQAEQETRQIRTASERYQRNESNLQKENLSFQERQKYLKSQITRKQSQSLKLRQDFDELLKKVQTKNDNFKHQKTQIVIKEQLQERLQSQRLLGIYETQIKYFQIQAGNQKQQINELKIQNNKLKAINEQQSSKQYEWREHQRTWQIEKQQFRVVISHLQRQNKEIQKKLNQQEHQFRLILEQYEKEKKNHKINIQKAAVSQGNLKKAQDQNESLKTEKKTALDNVHAFQSEVSVLKGELNYSQDERKKYVKLNQQLQFQLRKAKQQINQSHEKKEYEQERYSEQSKRLRDQLVKYENRLKIAKGQGQKFKDSLRSIILQNLLNGQKTIGRGQEGTFNNLKLKEEKCGLTLTNELLFKLEQYLKQMLRNYKEIEIKLTQAENQLGSAREENILKKNQAQYTQTQLKIKMQQLIQDTQKFKKLASQRQNELQKKLEQTQWQTHRLEKELKSVHEVKQHLSNDLIKRTQFSAELQSKNQQQSGKIKAQLKQLYQKCLQISEQLQLTQNYCSKLQQQVNQYRKNEEIWLRDKQNLLNSAQALSSQLQQSKASIKDLLKCKSSTKQALIVYQSQIEQYKILQQQYRQQIREYQSAKCQQSGMVRSLIKQKETLLHEYLKSQQHLNTLQSKQYELTNNIKLLEQLNSHLTTEVESYRSNNRNCNAELKKLKELLNQNQLLLLTYQQDKKTTLVQFSQKASQLEQELAGVYHQLSDKAKKVQAVERQLKDKGSTIETLERTILQLTVRNNENDEKLGKQRQISFKCQLNLRKITENLKQLQESYGQLKVSFEAIEQELSKAKLLNQSLTNELSEKDLCNFQLSSEKYNLQTQVSSLMNARYEDKIELSDKISSQDAALLKLQQVCQQYYQNLTEAKRQIVRKDLLIAQVEQQRELQMIKHQEKLRASQDEKDQILTQLMKRQSELQSYKDSTFKIKSQISIQDIKMRQKLLSLEEKLSSKTLQIEKSKKQNQTICQLQRNNQERLKITQQRLQQQLLKSKIEAQNTRRCQQNLKLVKQEFAQASWNCEREVRKVIKSRVRLGSKGQGNQEQNENALKSLEDSVVQTFKKYKPN